MTTDPDRRLLAALLLRAARDAAGDDPETAAEARRWLVREGAVCAEWLDLDPGRVVAFLDGLEPLAWEQLTLFE